MDASDKKEKEKLKKKNGEALAIPVYDESDKEEDSSDAKSKQIKRKRKEDGGGDFRKNKKKEAQKDNRTPKKWSAEEEIEVAKAILATSASGDQEVNNIAFYNLAKSSLKFGPTRSQLYKKMKSMRKRFYSIQSELKRANTKENEFPYKTQHEAALYKIWKQIWPEIPNHNGNFDANAASPANANGNRPSPPPTRPTVHGNATEIVGNGNVQANAVALVGNLMKNTASMAGTLQDLWADVRSPPSPSLNAEEGRSLQTKRLKLQFQKLELFLHRLELLQEDCKLGMQNLESLKP